MSSQVATPFEVRNISLQMPSSKRVKRTNAKKRSTTTMVRSTRGVTNRNSSLAFSSSIGGSKYFTKHIAGFPAKLKTCLRWTQSGITSVAATTMNIAFKVRMNDAFKPENATVASCAGYGTLMGIYTKAFVVGAKIRCHMNNSGGSVWPCDFGMTITTLPTSLTTPPIAEEGGLMTQRRYAAYPDGGYQYLSLDIGKYFTKVDVTDSPDLYSTNASGPTQLVYCQIWSYNNSSGATIHGYKYEIDYDVIFTDPLAIGTLS